ncbi:MAG: trmD [Gammaproteobacteria bacterium]|jgi:tRNA (guanine37-N1)-methyltransferase|nr:trmD [Gammaproteobacteria bacterium]
MWLGIISLFPEIFDALSYGITGRAISSGLVTIAHFNPRDFTQDKHRRVDDRPYGGGAGMVMKVEPLEKAIAAAKNLHPTASVIYMNPQGQTLTQEIVQKLAQRSALLFLNGRYEGIDERIATYVDEEYSIGDYVISGGELASMVTLDAIIRCLPGALGDENSAKQDSFTEHRLDYPHYTRPECINGITVPKVLQSGDHKAIERWRLKQALGRTWQRRPDLFVKHPLTIEEQTLLNEFILENVPTAGDLLQTKRKD